MLNRLIGDAVLLMLLLEPALGQQDLLNFLIEQNEAAREKIQTAQYRVIWTTDVEVKEGLRHNKGSGDVKMKGDCRYSTQQCNASIAATGWSQKQTPSMVINDRYVAYWPEIGNAYIYQDDHQSLHELSGDSILARDLHTTPDTDSLGFAFGGESQTTFKEMMKLHPDKIRWTAEQASQPNGDAVYLIKRYSPFMNDPAKPDAVWTIDPQKGFLVTQAVFYSRAANVWVTRQVEARQIDNGIWLPVSYQENRYGKPNDPQALKTPNQSTSIQLQDISVNHQISDDCFTIEAILPEEYRKSTTLFRKGLDGNTEAYVYRSGTYVLRKDWFNLDHAVAKELERLNKDVPAADEQQTPRQTQLQAAKTDQAASDQTNVPFATRHDDRLPAYALLLFGLPIVLLLVCLSVFAGRKSNRRACTNCR